MNRRLTDRNLSAVLEQIDYIQPRNSPILRLLATPHPTPKDQPVHGSRRGNRPTARPPALVLSSRQTELLTQWIGLVTDKPIDRTPTAPDQENLRSAASGTTAVAPVNDEEVDRSAPPDNPTVDFAAETQPPVQASAVGSSPLSADPFDPAEFNAGANAAP